MLWEQVIKQGHKNKHIVNLKNKQKFKNRVKLTANVYIILIIMQTIDVYVLQTLNHLSLTTIL